MTRSIFYTVLWAALLTTGLFAQVPYYGPTSPSQGNAIQVQLMVYDQPELGGIKIESVTFHGVNVSLQPPDLYGFRGGGGFQFQPGSYQLTWRVSNEKVNWPRSLEFKKTIVIKPQDTWVQVTIQGDKANVL